MKEPHQTDKQYLQVIEIRLVWNGRAWVTMYDILEQPSCRACQAILQQGDWTFISQDDRRLLVKLTVDKLNQH